MLSPGTQASLLLVRISFPDDNSDAIELGSGMMVTNKDVPLLGPVNVSDSDDVGELAVVLVAVAVVDGGKVVIQQCSQFGFVTHWKYLHTRPSC